jgi:hypothetical protein
MADQDMRDDTTMNDGTGMRGQPFADDSTQLDDADMDETNTNRGSEGYTDPDRDLTNE